MSDEETYIIKPRDDPGAIVKLLDPSVLEQLLDEPMAVLAGVVSEYIKSGNGFLAGVGCRIVQAAFKAQLFQQFGREIDELRAKGKLPDNFSKNKNGYKSWIELMTILDEESPDEDRFEALKAMFYGVNKINATDRERILNYQLFQIAKALKSGELLVLRAIFESYEAGEFNPNTNDTTPLTIWLSRITNRGGLSLTGLVLRAEPVLIEQGLITRRVNSSDVRDDQQVVFAANARLTDLGIRFREAIKSYRLDKE
jgi:hypothetical protein